MPNRRRRRRRLLLALPVVTLATGGVVYMATNVIPTSYAGVKTFPASCQMTPAVTCATTAP